MNWKEALAYYTFGVCTTAVLAVGYVDYKADQIEKKYYEQTKQYVKQVQQTIKDAGNKIAGDLEKKLEVETDQIRDWYGIDRPKRK